MLHRAMHDPFMRPQQGVNTGEKEVLFNLMVNASVLIFDLEMIILLTPLLSDA
jgi:hypothetical protein